jgi:hypothetical protein
MLGMPVGLVNETIARQPLLITLRAKTPRIRQLRFARSWVHRIRRLKTSRRSNAHDIIRQVDEMMYEVKNSTRDNIGVASRGLDRGVDTALCKSINTQATPLDTQPDGSTGCI